MALGCTKGRQRSSGEPYFTHPVAVAILSPNSGSTTRRSSRRCCTTRSRTPTRPMPRSRALRRGDRATGRRRDQAHQPASFRSVDTKQAENFRKLFMAMSQGPAGAPGQARRPAAQHAHHQVAARREAGAQGARDDGHLRAAGRPHGHAVDARGTRRTSRSRSSTPRRATRSSAASSRCSARPAT